MKINIQRVFFERIYTVSYEAELLDPHIYLQLSK